ncbi:MAG TPA: MBL fold metallo-hydrolase [Vicinamibacterales bacterium]|nr:MBL fold metallo-hydrolase [Vicinamibacterales bacterium]
MRIPTLACVLLTGVLSAPFAWAQGKRDMTPDELSRLTTGTPEQARRPFPPHKVVGNVYFVGTEIQGAFLVTTSEGHILINTNFEEAVPVLRGSVEKLGFKFTDIKIVLGSHAHGDHMEGDALVKQVTGAQVMAMAEDVPALERMRPGGKPHPIDRVLHDGDEVRLGGTTLVAVHTPGHTSGNTTWTLRAEEDGRTYNVVIMGGMGVTANAPLVKGGALTPLAEEYIRSFKLLRSLPCDVPLGSHSSMYNMTEKYARLGRTPNGPNPFIDREAYLEELDARERVFNIRVEEQKKAGAR